MRKLRRTHYFQLLAFCLVFAVPSLHAATLVMLGGAGDAETFDKAFGGLRPPPGISFQAFCMTGDNETAIAAAKAADVIAVNGHVVELRKLAETLAENPEKHIYALPHRRLSPATKVLAAPQLEPYRSNLTPANCRAITLWLMKHEFQADVQVPPPELLPEAGLLHPSRKEWFKDMDDFRAWSLENGRWHEGGTVVCTFHSPNFTEHEHNLIMEISQAFETRGMNFVIAFGNEVPILKMLMDKGKPQADAILAFSFKFKANLGKDLALAMANLGVPVFNALSLYRQTTPQWRESLQGMNNFAVAFGFIAPETAGLIEPTLLFGSKEVPQESGGMRRVPELMHGNLDIVASRIAKWIALRHKTNADKHVAIFVYNGAGGKQSIAASGLNVAESLNTILNALKGEGYSVEETIPSGEELMRLIIKGARNAGSWAQGEVCSLADSGLATLLPLEEYSRWFAEIPKELQDAVVAEWGPPSQSKIMRHEDNLVLPMLRLGNIVILPEPMRGWLDDPHKLLHSKELPPHHQYLAVYLWLRRLFKADAMIHLGRHGSSEWLPGKQLGLDSSDAASFIRSDIPEIYPYISDGIGEGIVAKRRGSAVIIDHLTPLLHVSPGEIDWPSLQSRISDCETADPAVQQQRRESFREHLRTLSLPVEIDLDTQDWFEEFSEYVESRIQPAPYGLHVFGKSPIAAEVDATAALLPNDKRDFAIQAMRNAGDDEMASLLAALSGRFIPPGPSGDPLRRPGIRVGRNFYSFDPAKIPSDAAARNGARLADELLEREHKRLGHFPKTVAIMLWAGEAIRTDGQSEALALALMGMEPTHDKQGNCTGVRPIPATRLNRPRIDVLLTATGAYRDQFGSNIEMLESARRQAAALRDAENYISTTRPAVFFPKHGTYGLRINRVTGASWLWDDRNPIVQTYLDNMAFTTSDTDNARSALEEAAANVESVVQSRSSNVYGITDIDESFQYYGGLSAAVEALSGRTPGEYIADARRQEHTKAVSLKNFLAAELDSRLFNKEWLARMKEEEYAGASLISRMVDNLWGWQATSPHLVTQATWDTAHAVLIKDKYGLGLREFLSQEKEWAYQSVTARLLEANRKGFWTADDATRRELASGYLHSVLRAGMACCDHTCNNPTLNQMVVQLVSVPGGIPSDVVQQFRLAVEQAAGRSINDAEKAQSELRRQIAEGFSRDARLNSNRMEQRNQQEENAKALSQEAIPVRGFKMTQMKTSQEDAQIPASGLEWKVLVAIFMIICVFAVGVNKSITK